MATVTPPRYTKQVMVLLEPEVSGEVYAFAEAAGISASAMCRDLIAVGLSTGRKKWAAIAPDAAEIERLRAEHRRQGEAQTKRRREDDADRRKAASD
jgi:hypothetical protein